MNDILESNDGEGFEQFSGDEDLAGYGEDYEAQDLSDIDSNPEALIANQDSPLTEEDVSAGIKRLETDLKNTRITMRHFNNAAIDAFKTLVEFSLYKYNVWKNDPVYEKILEDYNEFSRKFKNSDDFKLGSDDVNDFLDKYRDVLQAKKDAWTLDVKINISNRLRSSLVVRVPNLAELADSEENRGSNAAALVPAVVNRIKKQIVSSLDSMDPAFEFASDHVESWQFSSTEELQGLISELNVSLGEFNEFVFSEEQLPEIKRVVSSLDAQFIVRNDSLVKLFKDNEVVSDFETKSLLFLKNKYSGLVSSAIFMTDMEFEANDQVEDMISRLRQEQEDDWEGNSRRVFSDEELRDDFYTNGDVGYLRKKYGKYIKDNSFFRDLRMANVAKIDKKFYTEKPKNQALIDYLFQGINFYDTRISRAENSMRVKARAEFVYSAVRGLAESKGLLKGLDSESDKYCTRYIDHLYTDLSGSLITERSDFRKNGFGPNVLVSDMDFGSLRPMCETVRVLKPVNISKLITWISKMTGTSVEDLYMTRDQMEMFKDANQKALRIQAREFHMNVHNLVIEKELTFNRKKLIDAYDEAFKIAKARGITDVPSRDPLMYEYPPRPIQESASEAEHENYANLVTSYEERIRRYPELSPYEPAVVYSNENTDLDKFNAALFGSLVGALKKVPVYGYFKLTWSVELAAELDQHVTRDSLVESIIKASTVSEKDPDTGLTTFIVPSFHDIIKANPTFQVIPSHTQGLSVFIKNREYKIRQVFQRGGFRCAWYAPTDAETHLVCHVNFVDYLKRMQQIQIRKYAECFQEEHLSRQTYFRSIALSNHIVAINMYLVRLGLDKTPFTRNKVQDVNILERLSVRKGIAEVLSESKAIEVESYVHGLFSDIYYGSLVNNTALPTVPNTLQVMELVVSSKSRYVGEYLKTKKPTDTSNYRLYRHYIDYAMFKLETLGAKTKNVAEVFFAEFPVSPDLLYGITVSQRYELLMRVGDHTIERTVYSFAMSSTVYKEMSQSISVSQLTSGSGDVPTNIAKMYMDRELQKIFNVNDFSLINSLIVTNETSVRNQIKSKHTPLFAEFLLADLATRIPPAAKPAAVQAVQTVQNQNQNQNQNPGQQSSGADEIADPAVTAKVLSWFTEQGSVLTKKDVESFAKLSSAQVHSLLVNKYVQFEQTRFIDIAEAKSRGVQVRINKSETFAVGGEFPEDPIAYRYKDQGLIKSHLVDICRFVGLHGLEDPVLSKFFEPPTDVEIRLMQKVCEFKASRVVVLVRLGALRNMDRIRDHLEKYAGFKDLSDGNVEYVLFGNTDSRGFLNETKIRKTDAIDYGVSGYLHSILVTKNGEITRRVHKALGNELYPVPIRYTQEGFPVFSSKHKEYLKHLIEAEQLSPYLKNKIKIEYVNEISSLERDEIEARIQKIRQKLKSVPGRKPVSAEEYTRNIEKIDELIIDQGKFQKIVFSGTVPFLIDESSTSCLVTGYYVEQVFRDPDNHGTHMTYRIGVDETKGKTQHTYLKRMDLVDLKLDVNPEMEISNKFYKDEVAPQSETFDLVSKRIEQSDVPDSQLARAGAFSILDSHPIKPKLKYDPTDVWTWNFEKDKKSHVTGSRGPEQLIELMHKSLENPSAVSFTSIGFAGSNDFEIWNKEYKRTVEQIRESLHKNGSASSKFIDDVNEASKRLQEFRQNLPSQQFRASHGITRQIPGAHKYTHDYVQRLIPDFDVEFLYKCFQTGLLTVDEDAVKMIRNFSSQFPGYCSFDITFDKFIDSKNAIHHQALKNVPSRIESEYSIVYGILENFNRTKNLIIDPVMVDLVRDLNSMDEDRQMAVYSEYPLALVLGKLKKPEWTVLKILEQTVREFYSDLSGDVLKFELKEPVNITSMDVLEFLGDSNYMNALYNRGYRKVMTSAERVIDYVVSPGGRFVVYNRPSVFHTKFEIPREVTRGAPMYINQMVIGSEKSEFLLCEPGARRAALVFNVDLTRVDPYFSVANAYTSYTKRNNVALTKDDVIKFVAKGGNPYSILEMTDNEVAARSAAHEVNDTQIKKRKIQYSNYSKAVTDYIFSKNKDATLRNLVAEVHFGTQYKKFDKTCLVKYIDEVKSAIATKKISKTKDSVKMYISQLHIFPDFHTDNWEQRQDIVTHEFRSRFGIELHEYLRCSKKKLEMSMSSPDSLLDLDAGNKLPFAQ